MKISLILEAINRWTGPVDAAKRSIGGLGAAVRQAGSRIMDMRDATIDFGHHFRKVVGEEGMARASRSMAYFRNQLSGVANAFTLVKYASAAAVIGLGEEFVRGVFAAGGAAEQMRVTLTRLEGSAARAQKAMSWMQTFAMGAGAQLSMDDIMRSYQMAKNFGMDPQGGSLEAFANLAATERVSLKQVLYAVKDAMEGTSTRPLANLGIKMKQGKKPGEDNTYLYSDLAGKWVTEHSAKTPEGVLKELMKIINSKYLGMASAQAQTVPGGIAQLKKLLYLFEMKVADSGVMDWALKRMNQFFAWVRAAASDGSLDRLAKKVADFMTGTGDAIINFVKSTDWNAVGKDLKLFGYGLLLIFDGIKLLGDLGGGGISGLLAVFAVSKIGLITKALTGFSEVLEGIGVTLSIFAVGAAAPIEATIAVIGALIAVGYMLWSYWDKISDFFTWLWNMMPDWAKIGMAGVMVAIDPLIAAPRLIMDAWDKLKAYFPGLADKMNVPAVPARAFQGGVADGPWDGPAGARKTKPAALAPLPQQFNHNIVLTLGQHGAPDQISVDGGSTLTVRRGPTGAH